MKSELEKRQESWRNCEDGKQMIKWLRHGLTDEELLMVMPALLRALDRIVDRVVEKFALTCGVHKVEQWAKNWLDGTDRSIRSANSAARHSSNDAWSARSAARAASEAASTASAAASAAASKARIAANSAGVSLGEMDKKIWMERASSALLSAVSYASDAVSWAWYSNVPKGDEEKKQQADDIRQEIPEWIWEV